MLFNDELAGTREVRRPARRDRASPQPLGRPPEPRRDRPDGGLARPLRPRRVEGVHAGQARRRRLGVDAGASTTTTDTGSSTRRSDSACSSSAPTRASRSTRRPDRPKTSGPRHAPTPTSQFVIYHSGYELPDAAGEREGPFHDADADVGVNRLLATLREHDLGPGDNVSAELGTTWFCLAPAARSRRPRARQAARATRRGQRDLGQRLDLVRAEPAGRRRVPRLPDPGAPARASSATPSSRRR